LAAFTTASTERSVMSPLRSFRRVSSMVISKIDTVQRILQKPKYKIRETFSESVLVFWENRNL